MKDWKTYFNRHNGRNPKPQTLRAISLCSNKGNALDLGSGNMIETKAMLDAGFKHVVAVDSAKEAIILDDERIDFKNCPFDVLHIEKGEYDLINAEYALPFNDRKNFDILIENIVKGLSKGGIFSGQFFGKKDSWNYLGSGVYCHSKDQVMKFLEGLEIIEFREEEKDAKSADGEDKHWHIFHFIAKRV